MHPSDALLDQLRHGELPAPLAAATRAHLATCAGCADRHARAEAEDQEIERALERLDRAARPHAGGTALADALIERARRGASIDRDPARPRARRIGAATALLVLAAAAAAAAMPGSPLRRWLRGPATFGEAPAGAAPMSVHPADSSAPTTPPAGIAVAAGDSVTVELETPQRTGEIRISLGAPAVLDVRATGRDAEFVVQSGGVLVRNRGSAASYVVVAPAGARLVQLRVGGRVVFTARGGVVGAPAARREADGSYVLSITGPSPSPTSP